MCYLVPTILARSRDQVQQFNEASPVPASFADNDIDLSDKVMVVGSRSEVG